MIKLPKLNSPARRIPSELLGIDVATTGTKVVKLKRSSAGGFLLTAADILPAVTFNGSGPASNSLLKSFQDFAKPLRTNYAAVAVSSPKAVVRLLSLPGTLQASEAIEAHLREHAGLEGPFRLSYSVTQTSNSNRGKPEAKFLAVAMPEQEALSVLSLMPAGPPAPLSLEISGLGALSAFLRGPGRRHAEDAVGVIESGARITLLALFNRNALILVRKFDFGFETLLGRIATAMSVDRDVAYGIVSDGSFDISSFVQEVIGPFLKQLSISRDFVERQEKCRIARLYLSGGMSLSRCWRDEMTTNAKLEVQSWNPFESVQVEPGVLPARLDGQQTRFTAALGAALGAWEAP